MQASQRSTSSELRYSRGVALDVKEALGMGFLFLWIKLTTALFSSRLSTRTLSSSANISPGSSTLVLVIRSSTVSFPGAKSEPASMLIVVPSVRITFLRMAAQHPSHGARASSAKKYVVGRGAQGANFARLNGALHERSSLL